MAGFGLVPAGAFQPGALLNPLEIDFWDPAPDGALTSASGTPVPLLYGDGPTFMSSPFDSLFLGNDPVPGKCTLRGGVELAIDEKKHGGVDGAALTINGVRPGRAEAQIEIWTQEQWEFFLELVPRIWRKPNKRLRGSAIADFGMALDIGHPYAKLWGFSSGVVIGAAFPEPGSIKGSMRIAIRLRQFISPGQKTTTTIKESQFQEDERLPPAKNDGGEPPSKTDLGPSGPKPDRTAGSH